MHAGARMEKAGSSSLAAPLLKAGDNWAHWQRLIDEPAVYALPGLALLPLAPIAPPAAEPRVKQPSPELQQPQRALTVGEAVLQALELSEGMDLDLRQQQLRQILDPHQPQ